MSFFKDAAAQHRPLDAGEYRIEIIAGSASVYKTPQTSGVNYEVRVIEPKVHADRVVRLRAIADGPAFLSKDITRDMELLANWSDAVGATAEDLEGAMKALWLASRGRRVWLTLAHKKDRNEAIEVIASSVRVEAEDVV